MTIRTDILSLIPEDHFITKDLDIEGVKRPPLAQRDTRRIVIYLRRSVIGPFVNRQDNDGDTIRSRIQGVDHVRVPARKWKSIEKVRGVQLCRAYGAIDVKYLYNQVDDTKLLANPVSVVFGDSAVASQDSAGIPSLAIYEQGISVQSVPNATDRLTHNALSDVGTMMNVGPNAGEGKDRFRTSLFDTLYVREGTAFLQSIVLDAPTPEALGFVLMTLDATRYGAGKQVLGSNIRNEVVGLLATRNEPPVTAYTVLAELGADADLGKAFEMYTERARAWGGHWVGGDKIEALRGAIRRDADGAKKLVNDLAEASRAYHLFVYGTGSDKRNRGKGGKKKGEETASVDEESS